MMRVHPAPWVATFLAVATPQVAGADVFPTAQLVLAPADPAQIVLRTGLGVLVSSDSAETFHLACAKGAGFVSQQPQIAVTASGTVLAGLLEGVVVGRVNACTWSLAGDGIENALGVDVAAGYLSQAFALVVSPSASSSVWVSDDDATSWSLFANLPQKFAGNVIVPPKAYGGELYVAGIDTSMGTLAPKVAKWTNEGATVELLDIDAAQNAEIPKFFVVDPLDSAKLYLVVGENPSRLLKSVDGALTWQALFTSLSAVIDLALSPDGSALILASRYDGMWRMDTQTDVFEQVSTESAQAIAWGTEGVYAYLDDPFYGFTLSVSTDQGDTFSARWRLSCLLPMDMCDADSSIGAVCPAEWPMTAQAIEADSCDSGGGGGSMGQGGVGGAPGAGGGSDTPQSGSSSVGSGGSEARDISAGCGCRTASPSGTSYTWLGLALGLTAIARRLCSGRSRPPETLA